MNNNETNKFKRMLQTTLMELDSSLRRRDAIHIETSADQLDQLLGAREREFAVRHLESKSTRLREARAALQRIDDGVFGICLECDEPIGLRRLNALPAAALCIRCQEASDCDCGATNGRPVLAMAA